jgi:hypothetical protein
LIPRTPTSPWQGIVHSHLPYLPHEDVRDLNFVRIHFGSPFLVFEFGWCFVAKSATVSKTPSFPVHKRFHFIYEHHLLSTQELSRRTPKHVFMGEEQTARLQTNKTEFRYSKLGYNMPLSLCLVSD